MRKGRGESGLVHALEAGGRLRSALPNSDRPCFGGYVGYGVDAARLGVKAKLGACASGFDNPSLSAATRAYDLDLRVHHAWDIGKLAIELGLGGGASVFTQSFDAGGGRAPARTSLVPFLTVGATASVDVKNGFYLTADLAGETHFIPMLRDGFERPVSFAMRFSVGAGERF